MSVLNIPGNDFIAGTFISVFQVITEEHVQKAKDHIHNSEYLLHEIDFKCCNNLITVYFQ